MVIELSPGKKCVMEFMDRLAGERDYWINKNESYYDTIITFMRYNIPEGKKVLEIGCGNGYLLNKLKPYKGVGIDISGKMVDEARRKYPHLSFYQMDAECITLDDVFDFVVVADTIGYFEDIQEFFKQLNKVISKDTRIIFTFHNFLWHPLFNLATYFKIKMPAKKLNWLNFQDIHNLLILSDLQMVREGRKFLIPKRIPLISSFFNRYIACVPLINKLCFMQYLIVRKKVHEKPDNNKKSISVIIPAQNEKGNIENAVKRMPKMGKHTELIFVEGNSSDGTYDEMRRVSEKYIDHWDIKYIKQDHKGKGDAVRRGFDMASGDILIILDSDLTVPPEDLPKFYNAISTGKGEFINGSRLVYPLEKQAMRMLNLLANKFFSLVFSWLLEQPLKDTLCGTKAISKRNWEILSNNRKYFGEFDPFGDFDLLFGASKMNLQIVEIPIRYRAREYGDIEIKRFQHGWLLLKMVAFALRKIKFI